MGQIHVSLLRCGGGMGGGEEEGKGMKVEAEQRDARMKAVGLKAPPAGSGGRIPFISLCFSSPQTEDAAGGCVNRASSQGINTARCRDLFIFVPPLYSTPNSMFHIIIQPENQQW